MMKGTERIGRSQLRKQVPDAALREKLTPSYSPGCKRLLLSDDYYPALSADNVEVVTARIHEVTPHSIVTADGHEREVDTIIFGTGFRVTNNPLADIIRGKDGRTLASAWRDLGGMQAHLGTTVPGFPNMFMMAGPNTGIGHTSLVVMIEAQIRYVLDCLRLMDERGAVTVEPRLAPFEAYNAEVQRKMQRTIWNTGGCSSWYLDANGRNSTLWPDFTWRFVRMTKRFDVENYDFAGRTAPALAEVG
jgi:cation diffusion facilitator CzcD-associated flavoprotein CzcO